MKSLVVFSIVLCFLFQSCSTIKFEKYYPLIADKQTIFSFSGDSANNNTNYHDTLICRVRKAGIFKNAEGIKKGIAILSPNAQVQGGTKPINFFYYEHPNHTLEDSTYITERSFSGLSCCFYEGKLYMGNMGSKDQRYWQDFFPNVFPRRIKIGVNYFYKRGDSKRTFTFIGKENIEVDNKKYDNCALLTVSDNFSGLKGNDTIWFAKKTGVIKWVKKTGYTGVITNN